MYPSLWIIFRLLLSVFSFSFLVFPRASYAYIPAVPTNDTNKAIQSGLNVTDTSHLYLHWYPESMYGETVSYQLVGSGSDGFTQGAIVQFSETNLTNETTTTPWIALVSCDANATDASMEDDIFTLAQNRGAVSAVLYSSYSAACIINPDYANPNNFDQIMDIFSTQGLTPATLLLYQFTQTGLANQSLYTSFNAQLLNESATVVNNTINEGTPTERGYLFAFLMAYNATAGPSFSLNGSTVGSHSGSNSSSSSGGDPSLPMIILYVITACVSAIFCAVIIIGTVRAIRHPERYGRHARFVRRGMYDTDEAAYGEESRARGLGRAILDTFPIIKFTMPTSTPQVQGQAGVSSDVEAVAEGKAARHSDESSVAIEMKEWELVDRALHPEESQQQQQQKTPDQIQDDGHRPGNAQHTTLDSDPLQAGPSGVTPRPQQRVSTLQVQDDPIVPAAIGRETCPICILDFEEGDDMRVLPCEGKHQFHQACVDPWLLELSSSCPLCREDFNALVDMMSSDGHSLAYERRGEQLDSHELEPPVRPYIMRSSHRDSRGRFSRYLRLARRRRDDHQRAEAHDDDPESPTEPSSPDAGPSSS